MEDRSSGVDQALASAASGIEALEVARVLSVPEAADWRDEMRAVAEGGRADAPVHPDAVREAAGRLLVALRSEMEAEDDDLGPAANRFEGAIHMLDAAGVVDGADWEDDEDELEQLEYERELNAGGTQADLVAVYRGTAETRGGRRVVLVLRFADGIAFRVEREPGTVDVDDWPSWRLTDDLGTRYPPGGGGGSDTEEHVAFRTAVPAEAAWVELTLDGDPETTFRVAW